MASLAARIKRLEAIRRSADTGPPHAGYADDPLGYIARVLRIDLTPGQRACVDALMTPPRRLLVSAGHSVGKSLLGACLVNWFFDCRDGLCLTTAPTERQVKDILWKEVRDLRDRAGLPDYWAGPKIPRLERSPIHFAHGFTARDARRFQGQHSKGGLLIVFDEAEGVEQPFWQALRTMLDDRSFFLALYNPTDPGSAADRAEQQADETGYYRRANLSCLDHPNVVAPPGVGLPIPGAITREQLRGMLLEDSTLLTKNDAREPGDVQLGDEWFRPGPVAAARCLGRRPSTAVTGLWSPWLFERVGNTRFDLQPEWPVVVGCDVGRYGDDHSVIVARKGYSLVHLEQHVKQPTNVIARRLREVCELLSDKHNSPRRIPCNIDEGGIGGGVIDQHDGYDFRAVNASCRPMNPFRYARIRDELWFNSRQAANEGLLDWSRIPEMHLRRLKEELRACKYEVIPGRDLMKVTPKDDIKKVLGRSPDLADAFNLCLYPVS